MTISFNKTRNQVAAMVLSELGVLGSGQSADSADEVLVYDAIDLRLKELHKDGIIYRKVGTVPTEFSLGAGLVSASSTADILFPIRLSVSDSSLDEPVQIISPVEYAGLPDKGRSGFPTKALWKGGSEFWFWPVPTAGATAKLVYEKYMDDSSASAVLDVDIAMLRSLKNLVRYDLADHWGKPEAQIVRWERVAKEAEKNIRKLNAPRTSYKTISVDNFDDDPNTDYDYHR